MKKLLTVVLVVFAFTAHANTRSESDPYIQGSIKTILQRDYGISPSIEVRRGEVFLPESLKENSSFDEIIKEIQEVKGVNKVTFVSEQKLDDLSKVWVMPYEPLFSPLIADVKWPRFSAGYHYTSGTDYEHAFDAVFGKSFSLVRRNFDSAFMDIGLQGAVYSVFDLGTDSFNLINADYFVGIPVTVKWGKLALMTRIYHQSSHVGDEYILETPQLKRVNLSYEAVDVLASYELTQNIRVYGGGGFLFDVDPGYLDKWIYQLGAEFYMLSQSLVLPAYVLAVDIKGWEETGYKPNVSIKAGMALNNSTLISLDFYSGDSPHGQFYVDRLTYVGLSISFY